jgi:hypothetical protein
MFTNGVGYGSFGQLSVNLQTARWNYLLLLAIFVINSYGRNKHFQT